MIDWLTFKVAFIHKLLVSGPVQLVVDGRVIAANLRAEMLTRHDLLAQLGENGVATSSNVSHRASPHAFHSSI